MASPRVPCCSYEVFLPTARKTLAVSHAGLAREAGEHVETSAHFPGARDIKQEQDILP